MDIHGTENLRKDVDELKNRIEYVKQNLDEQIAFLESKIADLKKDIKWLKIFVND